MKFAFSIILTCSSALLLLGCDPKMPTIPNEEEIITTVIYTLTPLGGGADVVFKFTDLDGDAGMAPIIENGVLAENTTYMGSLQLLNEIENPAKDITAEVATEAEEHQFFYLVPAALLKINYTDLDQNNLPVGIKTNVTPLAAGTGNMTIILRHQPNKTAAGVAGGDITNAGGETDIEVTFFVDVQ